MYLENSVRVDIMVTAATSATAAVVQVLATVVHTPLLVVRQHSVRLSYLG